ncbi:ataxin-2-like protein [Dendronephthya gigantea]|uniref:ataxin-2-like protein n=1 Tax=Dendronephthya gigantea TaxID=151771 RepID=UPI00106A75F5|nr:ataxin-2-like protein [Dendronephthya gigantea]
MSNSASPRMKRGMASRGGPGRGRYKSPSATGSQQSQTLEGLYLNERLVNAVTSVVGCTAKVTSKNGKQFEGVLKTISPEASLVLAKANQVEEQRQNGVVDEVLQKGEIFEQLVMHHKDWVLVEFENVNLEECYRKDSFKTDNAISSNKRMNGQTRRELERWEPDGAEPLESTLEGHRMENGWSAEKMFEKNEKMYGVKSTYNEEMEEYTTKLDKDDTPEYRERERFAAQKAEEIFKESPYERNTLDSGRSEEQLYSSVVRSKNFGDRSSAPNWRQPHGDRPPPEHEQRSARMPQEAFGSPVTSRKELMKTQQVDEPPTVQVKKNIEKSIAEISLESKPADQKPEAFTEVVKAETVSTQSQSKPPLNTAITPENTPVIPQVSAQLSSEAPNDTPNIPEVTQVKERSQDNVIDGLKEFHENFKLQESKKKGKTKKVLEEEEKTPNETTAEEVKNEEPQTLEDASTAESDAADKKTKLNPNATEFRPRVKRNTPSPRSSSTASSNGAPSPFQNNSSPFLPSHSPYPPNNIYINSRNGPRGRGIRQDFMDPTTGYVNASNAAGQPLFAHHIPPQFMHQTSPHGMGYMPPGGIRHPGIQHPVFIQQHPHQVMVPLTHGYPDNAMYYGAVPMIQSPPQITSPSLQQSQFNFPTPSLPQPVRPVNQPPAVMPPQPTPPPVFLVRPATNEMQPTQIINRPSQPQPFQGN